MIFLSSERKISSFFFFFHFADDFSFEEENIRFSLLMSPQFSVVIADDYNDKI